MQANAIQLILPGLFDLPVEEFNAGFFRSELPNLNRLLRQSDRLPNRHHTLDSMVSASLGWRNTPALPLAQAYAGSSSRQSSQAVLFQAVYLQADMQDALIHPIQKSDDFESELSLLINDLGVIFKVDLDIESVADNLFLMRLKKIEVPRHYPHILSVLGKTANPYFEQTRECLPWYRLVNEMQMFLHQHDVNQERLKIGRLPVNSLWFWGAGEMPEMPQPGSQWYCDDTLFTQFAEACAMPVSTMNTLTGRPPGVDSVIIDLRLLTALKSPDSSSLEPVLLALEQEVITPVIATGLPLRLRAGFDWDFSWKASSRFKFWRKNKSLLDWYPVQQGLEVVQD